MTREREIFLQALEQSGEARSAFVERATVGDPTNHRNQNSEDFAHLSSVHIPQI